jgi:hypothetical protein
MKANLAWGNGMRLPTQSYSTKHKDGRTQVGTFSLILMTTQSSSTKRTGLPPANSQLRRAISVARSATPE